MALTYQAAVEQTITAGEQIHQIVNGTATTEVTVEDGSKVPSVRKALLDNFYFKDPIAWQVGQTENVFNQLRKFTDGSWWYAPSATASNPISMGSTPVGDPLWKIYDFDAIGKLEPRLDDLDGFTANLLAEAGIVDNGQPDTVGNSKRVDALHNIFTRAFANVEDMLVSAMLQVGQIVKTLGYYAVGDGGGAQYIVKQAGAADGYANHNSASGLLLEIINEQVNSRMIGAFPSTSDVGVRVNAALAIVGHIEMMDVCNLESTIQMPENSKLYSNRGGGFRSITPQLQMIKMANANTEVNGLYLKTFNQKGTSGQLNCAILVSGSGAKIFNNNIISNGGSAVYTKNASNFTICDNTITQTAMDPTNPVGEYVGGTLNSIHIGEFSEDFYIQRNNISNASIGIALQTVIKDTYIRSGIITDNIIKDMSSYGIILYQIYGATSLIKDIEVTGNNVQDIHGSCLNTAANNQKTYGAGIYCLNSGEITISHNKIKRTNLQTNSETLNPSGIAVSEPRGVINVSNNTVSGASWYGIGVFTQAQFGAVSITDNILRDNLKSDVFVKAADDVNVCGNLITNSTPKTGGAISFSKLGYTNTQRKGCTITDNSIIADVNLPIQVYGYDYVTAQGNRVMSATAIACIDVDSCNVVSLISNALKGNDTGIRGNSVTTCVVTSNTINVPGIALWVRQPNSTGIARDNQFITSKRVFSDSRCTFVTHTVGEGQESSSSYTVGSTITTSNPVAGGYVGKICTVAGETATAVFKGFGVIQA